MANVVVENLKYKYPATKPLALDGISFSVKEGEFIGIIGKNGSGKSTLCQALAGLVPHFYKGAYGGKVFIDEMEVKKTDISNLCERVGIVFQNPFNQVTGSKLSVYEEIAFGLENLGVSRNEMIKRIDAAMELLDLTKHKEKNPFDLSGGQMQRMALAGIIAMQPEVIILDEPTSQLDPQGREEVYQAVLKLAKKGITIFMVDHNMEKIAEYCDKVILLNDGKLIDFNTPEEIFSRNDLKEYGVDEPVFTKIAKALFLKTKETNLYPVTLERFEALYNGRGKKNG